MCNLSVLPYLKVSMHDILFMKMRHSGENFCTDPGSVFLGVVLDLDDAIKELAASETER